MEAVIVFGIKKEHIINNATGWFSPAISVCINNSESLTKLHMIIDVKHTHALLDVTRVRNVITCAFPHIDVNIVQVNQDNPFDPKSAVDALMPFVKTLQKNEEYIFSLGSGTHMHQHFWLKLAESGWLDARIIQNYQGKNKNTEPVHHKGVTYFPGRQTLVDFNLSQYDVLVEHFSQTHVISTINLKSGINTVSKKYNALISDIEKVAVRTDAPILIQGASGAGKSALAARIGKVKKQVGRSKGEWVMVNCATLTEEQAVSTLFGHKKGSFTGAVAERSGLLKRADGGVLFLDEVSSLPPRVQGMLLHAIETGTFYPLGSDIQDKSHFCLIVGSNEDLRVEVEAGRFREDLLARLDMWTFKLPSLAERKEDIPANIDFELAKHTKRRGQVARFNREARVTFEKFARSKEALWKRNFRDLSNAIERMLTLSDSRVISEIAVECEIKRLLHGWGDNITLENTSSVSDDLCNKMAQLPTIERKMLEEVIRVCQSTSRLVDAANALYQDASGCMEISNPSSKLSNYLGHFNWDLTYKKIKNGDV
jgi:transcriptional regulatory protein RtcR